jgi:hypothetical protein
VLEVGAGLEGLSPQLLGVSSNPRKMTEAGTIDFLFVMPSSSVHRIQEAQTTTYHWCSGNSPNWR